MPSLASTAPPARTQPRLFPVGAWDAHHHIFDLDRFRLAETRHFTPDSAPLSALEAFHHDLGIDHPALAHGLSFGRDLSSLEFYLEHFEGSARAYGVIDLETVTDQELERLYLKVRAHFSARTLPRLTSPTAGNHWDSHRLPSTQMST